MIHFFQASLFWFFLSFTTFPDLEKRYFLTRMSIFEKKSETKKKKKKFFLKKHDVYSK